MQARRASLLGRHGRRRGFALGSVVAVAVVLAAALGAQWASGRRPVTYAVGQGADEQSGYIRGIGRAGSNVNFSDGTRIDLSHGARLSVLARGRDGARLRVEEGEAHFEVVHRPRAAWSVEAGPFVVYVTGTSFDVRWSGSDEIVEVRLRSGSVRVGGPLLPERVTLRPGQRLTGRLASGELRIDEARPAAPQEAREAERPRPAAVAGPAAEDDPDSAATAVAPDASPVGSSSSAQASASREVRSSSAGSELDAAGARVGQSVAADAPVAPAVGSSRAASLHPHPHRARVRQLASIKEVRFAPSAWVSAVAVGAGSEVLAQADAHGIDQTLAEVDAGALSALADAARYGGRRDLATHALLAERARFAGTPPAQVAAFLLGRLADDAGATRAALDWYRRYLTETPRGPYAAEALGRKMLGVERLYGRSEARPIAAEYVRRFSNGTYLLQAHSILANP